ncbi:MAG: hypothetical protein WCK35_04540 [Chloroflexota bacterium]
MNDWLSRSLDKASNYLASRKGLLPFIGIGLIILNFILVLYLPDILISKTNLALHLGIIVAIFGQLLAWAL